MDFPGNTIPNIKNCYYKFPSKVTHRMDTWNRRRVMKAVMAGGDMAFWPCAGVFAQSGGTLLRSPKQALVIGNSKYRHAPLKNPVNDASGMAEALKSADFGVTFAALKPAWSGMRNAIQAHTDSLARTKSAGLF
jgi:hypothetical protein